MFKIIKLFIGCFSALFFISCLENETNPFDVEGDGYEVPELTINWDNIGTNITKGGILLEESLTVIFDGNTKENEFRYAIDNDQFSQWSNTKNILYRHLDDGSHTLYIQTRYPGGEDIDSDTIPFTVSLLPQKAVYVYPYEKKYSKGEAIDVQVRTKGIESCYLMHLELLGATIISDSIIYNDSGKANVFSKGSVIDIAVLGGSSIIENGGVVSLKLNVTDTTGAFHINAILKDSLDQIVAVDTVRGGYIVEK